MSEHTNPAFVADEVVNNRTIPVNCCENDKPHINNSHNIELSNFNKGKDDSYDPYDHRDVTHPTTNTETFLHLLKGCLGTGILAMPKAFYHSGYAVGTVATILIGSICTYCIHMLIRAEYELCKRRRVPSLAYHDLAETAFQEGPEFTRRYASYAKHAVNIFLLIYQLGICCVYVVFIGANVKSVCDNYFQPMSVSIYMLIFLIPLILINWVRNLKRLAPLSTAANVVTLVGYAIIFYYIIRDGPTFYDRKVDGTSAEFPLFMGTVLFSLEAIGVIMPLENEMKTPQYFAKPFGVLNCGMFTVVGFYFIMGLLGYLTYGSEVEGSITLNLPKDDILAQTVKLALALAIYVTHALQCYVAVDILWNFYIGPKLEKDKWAFFWEYVLRTSLVIVTFLLAVAIPALDLFISLFGAFCLSAAGLAIPAAIDTCTFWFKREGYTFYLSLIKNILFVIFGVCGLFAGTYTSIKEIIAEFL